MKIKTAFLGSIVLGTTFFSPRYASADDIYVSYSTYPTNPPYISNTVFEIGPDGSQSVLTTAVNDPGAIASDTSGDLFVTSGSSNIDEITPYGIVSTFVSNVTVGPSLAIDSDGDLFTPNRTAGTITEISSTGIVSTFASGFGDPLGLAFNSSGDLFVSNLTSTIYEVTPQGIVSPYISDVHEAEGLAFDPFGNLYVANQNFNPFVSGTVTEITPSGAESTFGTGFLLPLSLQIDASGNVYVGNYLLPISKIAANGTVVGPVGYEEDIKEFTVSPSTILNSQVWSNAPSDGNWTNAADWESGSLPGTNTLLAFGSSSITSLTNNLPIGIALAGLNFGTNASPYTIIGNTISLNGGVIANNSTNLQVINTPLSLTYSQTITTTSTGGNLLLNGSISGTGGFFSVGSGTLSIVGSNTFSGGIQASSAELDITNGSALGIGPLSVSGATVDLGGCTITNTFESFTGGTIRNGFIINNCGTYELQSGTVFVTLAGSNGLLVNGSVGDTVDLELPNTYTGGTVVRGGNLVVAQFNYQPATLGSGPLSVIGGAIDFQGGVMNTSNNPLTMTGGIITNATITNDGNAMVIQGGTIGGGIVGSGSLNMTGEGTLCLSASNSFTGPAYVTTGTLLIASTGTLSGGGSVTVSSGSTLENDGFITGNTTVNGSVAGNGGSFNYLRLAADSSLIWNINSFTGTAHNNWDELNAYSLDLSALSSTNPLTIYVEGISGGAATNAPSTYVFNFIYVSSGITGFDPSRFMVNTSLFNVDPSLSGGVWFVGTNSFGIGTELTLTYAVPEASGYALLGMGLGVVALGIITRRRRV